jgi:monoamine oxidase
MEAGRQKAYDVLIIGGGFSGVTAARELRRHGRNVLLIEARDRLGGRTWFKTNALNGMSLEMGGTWIDTRERYAWAEAQRYGLALSPPAAGNWPSVWLVRGELRYGMLPVPPEELRDLERLAVALNRAASRIDLDRPLPEQNLSDLDISLNAFLDTLHLSAATHDIAGLFLRTYGSSVEEDISALHLIRRIAAAGSLAEFVMSASGYRIKAGTSALLKAIADDAKAETKLSAPVRTLRQDERGVTVETAGGSFRGRAAVVTVPPSVWKDIAFDPPLNVGKRSLSTEELACKGVKVWALVRGAPRDFFANGRGAGLDWLESDGTEIDGATLMVGYGADADLLDIADRSAVQAAVRSFVPNAEVIAVCGHDWRHDPFSRETWAVFRPGQITKYDADMRKLEGRVVFAGSHTATRWPGFIDGAIESAIRAARETHELLQGEASVPGAEGRA